MKEPQYDYKQLHVEEDFGRTYYTVKGYKSNGYPKHSVCVGMTRINFIDSYESEAEAIEAHPDLVSGGEVNYGSAWMDKDLKDCSHIQEDPFQGGSWDRFEDF